MQILYLINLEASLGHPIILLHIRNVRRLSQFYDFRFTRNLENARCEGLKGDEFKITILTSSTCQIKRHIAIEFSTR